MKRFGLIYGSLFVGLAAAQAEVVINELHYDPPVKTDPLEFVELHNPDSQSADISGWRFTDGVEFEFPPGTVISPGGYLIVAQNPMAFERRFELKALGPFGGKLANEGETVELSDNHQRRIDRVDYQRGFPWPTVGGDPGHSIELIHPRMDNDLAGSWRSSRASFAPPGDPVLIHPRSQWRWRRGDRLADGDGRTWRSASYSDSGWETSFASFGYGKDYERLVSTALPEMKGKSCSLLLRANFDLISAEKVRALHLDVFYDAGFVAWINGVPVVRRNVDSNDPSLDQPAIAAMRPFRHERIRVPLEAAAPNLKERNNILAIQVHDRPENSDPDFLFYFAQLEAEWTGSEDGPSPGRRNHAYAEYAPPQIRQVRHHPEAPRSGQEVAVSARVTDPDGVESVALQYQWVEPGHYIALNDDRYATDWQSAPMTDDGQEGDIEAMDDTYSVQLTPWFQQHRRLVRYRITATDRLGHSVTVPYADDPQPNFAYFVYDGAPAWTGRVQPNDPPATVSADEMNRLPIYHLITHEDSALEATGWRRQGRSSQYRGSDYPWRGTLVYEGTVYDHVGFRARGGVWRYAMGKNMWKIDFLRGHFLQAHDNYGRPYESKWRKLNLGASIQQADTRFRGEQGMFESVGYRLFQLAGVPACDTHFLQFRIIDQEKEADPRNQYEGDFWGLYLAVEQMDGKFLDQHGLPDGNLYKIEHSRGELNNLGPEGPSDGSDLNAFMGEYRQGRLRAEDWRRIFEVDQYYSYKTICHAIHHYDTAQGKNYFYYRNPETQRWSILPWDIDLTWADSMYPYGQQGGNDPFYVRVLQLNPMLREYQNRAREIRDLLFNEDQAWKLIEEYASLLKGPSRGPSLLDADRMQWDYHPVMTDHRAAMRGKAEQGLFYKPPGYGDGGFDLMVRLMKEYVVYRGGDRNFSLDVMARDPMIPATPEIAYAGPDGYPPNQLRFKCSNFNSARGGFQSIKWRLGEVRHPGIPGFDPLEPWRYEIEPVWESGELTVFQPEIKIPDGIVQPGRAYRARVRFTDDEARTSHWSGPFEFISYPPDRLSGAEKRLKISEIHYHPQEGTDYEFVELINTGDAPLDLTGIRITDGIEYEFEQSRTLPPQGMILLVNLSPGDGYDRIRKLYNLNEQTPVAGPYDGKLSNGGERILLQAKTPSGGRKESGIWFTLEEVAFDDEAPWPAAADGSGPSLQRVDMNRSANHPKNWKASRPTPGGR